MAGDLIAPRERPLTIGTAGHVDHGKTSLVRALTGVDTDRLVEERRRGMTIELGFAPYALPDGSLAGLVDVPGHAKLLKTMLAGATGVDVALLVVAADDGMMPQTHEHLAVLSALGVKVGVVALTKIDMVDSDLVELATEEVRLALAGTPLAEAPIVPVSAKTGAGLEALRVAIAAAVARVAPRSDAAPYRLPNDRAFIRTGFGIVVTGTLCAGRLRVGDAGVAWPSGAAVRVRGLHIHGRSVDSAVAGQRVAVNLAGEALPDFDRGDWLTAPGAVVPSGLIDVQVLLARGVAALPDRLRVRVGHGAGDVACRLRWLDEAKNLAQLVLDVPIVAALGDRLVLRRETPNEVLGGAHVLHPTPPRRRRSHAGGLAALAHQVAGEPFEAMAAVLRAAGARSVAGTVLLAWLPITEHAAGRLWLKANAFPLPGDQWLHGEGTGAASVAIGDILARFHAAQPARLGLRAEAIATRAKLAVPLVTRVAQAMADSGTLTLTGRTYALPAHRPAFPATELAAIRQKLTDQPLADAVDFGETPALLSLLEDLQESGEVIRVSGDIFLLTGRLPALQTALRAAFGEQERLTASQLREVIGTTRKYGIPFFEWLDATGFTRREGDTRMLRT